MRPMEKKKTLFLCRLSSVILQMDFSGMLCGGFLRVQERKNLRLGTWPPILSDNILVILVAE